MRTVARYNGTHHVGCAVRTSNTSRNRHRMAGLTYVEVLIATALIAVTLVPAIEALKPAIQGMSIHETQVVQHYELTALLENILATPFSELDAEAVAINDPAVASVNYSDPAGQANRRLVYLSRYDADNADGNGDFFDTGVDAGLLWVRVEIEGTSQAIESLTSVYD
jgi:type II secretory pathway pseudopilin PulG